MAKSRDHAAVVIAGGGTAGCATAIALAAHEVENVLVIDPQPQPAWRIGEAMPPACGEALRRLGVWEDFLAQGHLPSVGTCASWGDPGLGYNDFLLDAQGTGWHLDRAAFDGLLAARAAARGARLVRGFRLRQAERAPAGAYLLAFESTEGAQIRIAAGFLVDATGIAAAAARRLGVARNRIDCLAVISAVVDLRAHEAVPSQALLEACDYGWWYAAKLPRQRMVVALAVAPSQHQRFGASAAWLEALRATRHVSCWLERGRAALAQGPRLDAALAPSAILSRVAGERWLAVGDAASAYDPVAAQGILKALDNGAAAAEAIAQCLGGAGERPLLAYQDGVFAQFRDYLRLRRHLYGLERRWPEASFWRDRLDPP